jgi:predicted chitinase
MTFGKLHTNFLLLFTVLSSTLVFGGLIISIGPAQPSSKGIMATPATGGTSATISVATAGAAAPAAGALTASSAGAAAGGGAAAAPTATSAGAAGAPSASGGATASSAAGTSPASGAASSAAATGAAGGASGGVDVTKEEFTKAVTDCYPDAKDADKKYDAFIKGLKKSKISSKKEAAMFLAQILHESGGLIYTAEIKCKDTGCPGEYPPSGIGKPGKTYFGRGYIQLTWDYNYDKASKALFGDSRLVDNPEQVATNDEYSWGVSFWFWDANVHSAPGVQQGQFGAATNAINGPLECKQKSNPTAVQKRNANYAKCLKDFGISDAPDTSGC